MKKTLLCLCLIFLTLIPAKADEGMWLMMLIKRLNYIDMQEEGLKLTPEEIYSVNNSSLKDAIVSFGGFCTGEIISNQGLVLTNHHCGYSNIAELSTPENDYLKNGYWAKNTQQELPAKNLFVRFLVKMGDVSERINNLLKKAKTEKERAEIIKSESDKIEKENNSDNKYTVVVKSFFHGNEFYYFVYQDYKDIRFVGAPPSSIGKFGGDTDNWEWPRHTGDFSMFRIYADKNGDPAEYSNENIPYTPKHSLTLNIGGVKPGDFTMVIGYPGTTSRYLSSYGIQQLISYEYPPFIEASKKAMDVLKKHMDGDKAIQLNYAGKYASLANYWKNRIGMIEAINKNKVIEDKIEKEKQFAQWSEKTNYKNVLSDLENYYKQTNNTIRERMYLFGVMRSSSYAVVPSKLGDMLKTYTEQNEMGREAMKSKLIESVNSMYQKIYPEVEKDLLEELIGLYIIKVNIDNLPQSIRNHILKETEFKTLANNSIFESKEKIINYINNPNKKLIDEDPLYILSKDLISFYMQKDSKNKRLEDNFNQAQRLYIKGLEKTFPNVKFYPDANSTMRLTYGTVKTLQDNPQKPNDAKLNYYTTLKGMIAKYKKDDAEFDLPQKLIDLYNAKDYGEYANENGELPIDFLSNNDITGGNSGSPIINGKGELIGLAFDGNWEAMSGNIQFDNELQRCINTDIRFVLFIIEKYYGAIETLKEIKIIK
ncbi:S46 family peptidase [Apibacter adventoris]|uniref:S46 family peptidase n=1 Tax=Apibacter adventoris TaxID=1679466 RepID=UPI000CF6BF11|nr:S46 family peptidase [Apibacter adventoris]PQL92052.1 peptidase S46 [Apibacter adventoris]